MLLFLSKHFGKKTSEGIIFKHIFTHQDIANLTGLTREKVSIEMKKLVREDKISQNNRHIIIKNMPTLEFEVQSI